MRSVLGKSYKVFLFSLMLVLLLSTTSFAKETGKTKENEWVTLREFVLKGGEGGTKVEKLSSGVIDKEIQSLKEKYDSEPEIEVSASMDGTNPQDLYWSKRIYKNGAAEKTSVAVLKAGTANKWTKQSGIIVKLSDINGFVTGIEVEMGASKDGPRDYKIEYSLDGKKYSTLGNVRDSKFSIGNSYKIATVFQKDFSDIQRGYTTMPITQEQYELDARIYDDVYFKISPSSNYKVDGTKGLYGSSTGEMAIRAIRVMEAANIPSDTEGEVKVPSGVKVYKTAATKAKVTWKTDEDVDGYEIYLKKDNDSFKKIGTIKEATKTHFQIKKLAKNGIYKVRIRSYIKDGNNKNYSAFTKAVTLNMKTQIIPQDLSIEKKLEIKVGKTKKLDVKCVTGKDKNYIKKIQYKIKDTDIAMLENGKIEAKQVGTTSITTTVVLKSGLKKEFTTKIIVKK